VISELMLDIIPVLLGTGERLFDGVRDSGIEPLEVIDSPHATRSLPHRPLTGSPHGKAGQTGHRQSDPLFASSVHLLLAGRPRAPANGRPLEHVAEGSKQPPMGRPIAIYAWLHSPTTSHDTRS
jgi:hypothetical protein